jgi:decaprenylphospho-beta-D-ribofuranose 2-oxidase
MRTSGWGRYPSIDAEVSSPLTESECQRVLQKHEVLIARGLGRSYGDCANASQIMGTKFLNHYNQFDSETGLLTCMAGVTFAEILETFVPQGWFLPVTPGTRFVTVGGAIASDVHGKNHHVEGTFTQHVQSIKLLLGNGEFVECSDMENVDLFRATCGGMGLTGIILSASFKLKSIKSSSIIETTVKASCLDHVLELFEKHKGSTYSVAWIDCLASGKKLGRSLLMLGEHSSNGKLILQNKKPILIPFDMPTQLLNRYSVKAFNSLYYSRVLRDEQIREIPFEPFFYPLDRLSNWNRLYGKQGLLQYQFVLPKEAGVPGLKEIIQRIANSGRGSFLAVLKEFGNQNSKLISFPREGYTLALDFKVEASVFNLLSELDQMVLQYGGRLFLAKDARMSEDTFRKSYPQWERFEEVRSKYYAIGKFASNQSKRLGLQ